VIVLENVTKTYRTRSGAVKALDDVSLRIEKGEFIVVRGPSGSGKTTLLMTIAGMLRPTGGSVAVDGKMLYELGAGRRARLRAKTFGFVFQMFHLIAYLNVIDNVVFAAGPAGTKDGRQRAQRLLRQIGLDGRALHKPSALSAGEKQRTAIARALLNSPEVLLADEPTGNLDFENAAAMLGYLHDYHLRGGTVIIATHRKEAQELAGRTLYMQNGSLASRTAG